MPRNHRSSSRPQAPKSWRSSRGDRRRPRSLSVRSELRQRPDSARIARAIVELAATQAQAGARPSSEERIGADGEARS